MKKISLAVSLILISTDAFALNRYFAYRMTPEEILSTVKDQGRAIFYYYGKDPNAGRLFIHAVSRASNCGNGEETKIIRIAAADGATVRLKYCVKDATHGDDPSPAPSAAPSPAPAPAPAPPSDGEEEG